MSSGMSMHAIVTKLKSLQGCPLQPCTKMTSYTSSTGTACLHLQSKLQMIGCLQCERPAGLHDSTCTASSIAVAHLAYVAYFGLNHDDAQLVSSSLLWVMPRWSNAEREKTCQLEQMAHTAECASLKLLRLATLDGLFSYSAHLS